MFLFHSSCLNSTCYRKKLQSSQCTKYGISYTESSAGRSIIGGICVEGDAPLTFFTQQWESLIEQLELDCNVADSNFTQLLAI